MKNTKELNEALRDMGYGAISGTETYGRETFSYVVFSDNESRRRGEAALEGRGFSVSRRYHPNSVVSEVRVKKN